MKRRALEEGINEKGVAIILTGGFVKLPRVPDERFWTDTRGVAKLFSLTPRRVRQLCVDEGLPKQGRDRFYIPDIVNWRKVRFFAKILNVKPNELIDYGVVDFTLGKWWEPETKSEMKQTISKILTSTK
jgi:hypothetical protein